MPKYNPGTQRLDKVQTMIRISSTTDQFNVAEMGYFIDCLSVSHPNLKCIFSETIP